MLEDGLIDGIRRRSPSRLTVVGAERTDTDPSSIAFFDDAASPASTTSTSSPGRVALVYALGGAEGDFGVKETADALLPDLLARPRALGFGAERAPAECSPD